MNIHLPGQLKLNCPNCKKTFHVNSSDIGGINQLSCPHCSKTTALHNLLPPALQRIIYFKARRYIELLVQNYQLPPSG